MSEVEDQIIDRLSCYGKLGLLIEDAPDAQLRTARELYGTDGLPQWWVHCEDVESSAEALAVVVRAVVDGNPSWASGLPVVMVVDRYLKKAPSSTQVVPWDDPVEGSAEMVRMMERLRPNPPSPGSGSAMAIATVTSYFNPQGTPQSIGWQPRHHEPLFQLRRKMHPSLLAFGPADKVPVAGWQRPSVVRKSEEMDEAVCRGRLWDNALDDLAAAFRPNFTCVRILFTGAGASFANHPLAPGIPPTWFLLDWASWRVCTRDGRSEREEPTWPPRPAEEEAERADNSAWSEIHTVRELLDRFAAGHSARNLQWSLEKLFEDRPDNHARLEDLVNAFRQVLQRYDHDFPYHTWLLAHLPWTLIVTTNFDGFHERAAASVASILANPDAAEQARRLGDVLELPPSTSGSPFQRSDEEPVPRAGLFKPYGSLMRIGPLALTDEHFWKRIKPFQSILDPILARSQVAWLVIVGQRLASDALTAMLEMLLQNHFTRTIHVVWVDPSCCRRGSHPNAHAFFLDHFQQVVKGGGSAPGNHHFYPLPARALDFAYDLWGRWWRRQR
jgi:hypothetical protein